MAADSSGSALPEQQQQQQQQHRTVEDELRHTGTVPPEGAPKPAIVQPPSKGEAAPAHQARTAQAGTSPQDRAREGAAQ